jgi:hypothetical protein
MNRSMNFFIGLVAALITFGALTAAFGPRHSHWGFYGHRHGHDINDCHHDDGSREHGTERTDPSKP